jgi:hypothetical protein
MTVMRAFAAVVSRGDVLPPGALDAPALGPTTVADGYGGPIGTQGH